jgi:hypothetical protein
MTAKSFKVTGISNKMDRSENYFLQHWSDEEGCQRHTNDNEGDYKMK